jgi:hypothetical protein
LDPRIREHDRNDESNLQGKRFRTDIYLRIDPFFYFETLSQIPCVPPLIYSWRINSIFRETAPFIAAFSPSGGTLHVRDQSKLALEESSPLMPGKMTRATRVSLSNVSYRLFLRFGG